MSLSAPSSASGIAGAAAEIEHVAALGEIARQLLDLRLERERLRHQARHLDQRPHQLAFVVLRQHAARAAGGDREAGQHRELAGERLGRGDADLRAGERRHHDVALARDRRGRHVDDREDVLLVRLGVAQRRQRVGGLARLRDEDRQARRRSAAPRDSGIRTRRRSRPAAARTARTSISRPGRHSRRCRRPRSRSGRACVKSNGSASGSRTRSVAMSR